MLMKQRITDHEFLQRLRKARSLITRGWVQGAFCRRAGQRTACYCASGALARAGVPLSHVKFEDPDRDPHTTIGWMALVTWNDRPERTQAEVVAMFDNSIAALKAALALPSGGVDVRD